MPCPRRDPDKVESRDLYDVMPDNYPTAASKNDDGMGVNVPFKCRVTARLDLKISQLTRLVGLLGKKRLPRDVLKVRAFLLVVLQRNTIPPKPIG